MAHRNDKVLDYVPSATAVLPNTSKFSSSATVDTCVSPCICSLNCPFALLCSPRMPLCQRPHAPGEPVIIGPLCSLVSSGAPRPLFRKLALRSSRGFRCQTPKTFQAVYRVVCGAGRPPWPPVRLVRPIDLHARLVRVKRALTNHHGKSDLPCPRWLPHGPPRH
jgi:hypothetical protein